MTPAGARCLVATCAILMLPACSESPASPSATLTEQLAGTWHLVSLRATGAAEQPRPATATYSVTFEGGRLSARADCNTCAGTATIAARSVTVGPVLACTRAACATMAFESSFTTLLAGESSVAVSGASVVLTSGRGVMRFER
jgi:heat shock protein HslJ